MRTLILFLLLAVSCFAANPTAICTNGSLGATGGNCTGSVTSGSLMVVWVFALGLDNSSAFSASDTQGNSFNFVNGEFINNSSGGGTLGGASFCNFGNDFCALAFFVRSTASTNSDTITVAWTGSTTFGSMAVDQWTGQQASDPWDGASFNFVGSHASPISSNASSGQGANASDLALGACWIGAGTTASAGTGYTVLDTLASNLKTVYKTGTAGNSAATCTYTGSQDAWGVVLTFRPSATYTGIIRRQAGSCGGINVLQCKVYLTNTVGGTLLYIQGQINGLGGYTTSLSDSAGDTFVDIFNLTTNCFGGTITAQCRAGYVYLSAGVTWVAFNVTPADNLSTSVAEYIGLASSSPIDAQSTPLAIVGTITPWTSNAVTTLNANDAIIAGAVSTITSGTATLTQTGVYTLVTPNACGVGGCSQLSDAIVSSIQTAITNTGTVAGGANSYTEAWILGFKAAGAGATVVPRRRGGVFQ